MMSRRTENDGMGREYSKNGRDENVQKTMFAKPGGNTDADGRIILRWNF
jgi:hypothetical protein